MTVRGLRIIWIGGAVVVTAILLVAALINPRVAAAGWLTGFVFWSQVLLGSLLLVMIHRLTSGRWGEIMAPVVEPASAAVPWLAVLAVPVFLAVPVLYPWSQAASSVQSDVRAVYLNLPAFILRSAIAIVGWSIFALVLPRVRGGRGQLLAGLGLVFYALAISLISIDWYLSLAAPFVSSSFGASVAISSLAAAIAWAALCMPAATAENPAVGDVGALLLTTTLGLTYIDFMAVLVIWYGDLPLEVSWFVQRGQPLWITMATIAFVLVSVVPAITLIQSRVRNRLAALRVVGAGVLAGSALYDAYLVLPGFGLGSLATSLLAIAGIGLLLLGIASNPTAAAWSSTGAPVDAR